MDHGVDEAGRVSGVSVIVTKGQLAAAASESQTHCRYLADVAAVKTAYSVFSAWIRVSGATNRPSGITRRPCSEGCVINATTTGQLSLPTLQGT